MVTCLKPDYSWRVGGSVPWIHYLPANNTIHKLREAFLRKKTEFYERKKLQTWFYISYSEMYTVKVLNKDFIKSVRGGGVAVWFFIKFRFFLRNASLTTFLFSLSQTPHRQNSQFARVSGTESGSLATVTAISLQPRATHATNKYQLLEKSQEKFYHNENVW